MLADLRTPDGQPLDITLTTNGACWNARRVALQRCRAASASP
jgi:hypothetical protein